MAIVMTITSATEKTPSQFMLSCTACTGQHRLGVFHSAAEARAGALAHVCDEVVVQTRAGHGRTTVFEILVRGALLQFTEAEAYLVQEGLAEAVANLSRKRHAAGTAETVRHLEQCESMAALQGVT